ncbi:uncharacterized protein B0T15DRAFT_572074 [Chaetomium strumarium]|uniref:Uncharacterized protein n=1 Tax=Chaetomium strumarium TaxID=1170767 RepID=A0AAJ0GX36_9PEZI|nr:hypothetical protein B0T15DRAFT_572074 [Chaetomium strumarium]
MVRRWDRELRGQARTRREACMAILGHAIADPSKITDMFKDAKHAGWNDPELGPALAAVLGDRCDDWVETISDVIEAIKDLGSVLDTFSALLLPPEQVQHQGQVRKFAHRVKASFKEDDVRKSLKELGKLNRQLGQLQTGLTSSIPAAHHHSQNSAQDVSPSRHGLPQDLCDSIKGNHSRHSLKLFVRATPESIATGDCVTMKLGYAYEPAHCSQELRLLEFQIRSSPSPIIASMPTPVPDSSGLFPGSCPGSASTPFKKRRKVSRWADEEARPAHQAPSTPAIRTENSEEIDLRQSLDLCESMTEPIVKIDGYLQIRDRIQLAQSLVQMVLTLHSTPWLARRWTLRDLSFVRRGDDLVASLESLHIDAPLPLMGQQRAHHKRARSSTADIVMQLTPDSSGCSWAADETPRSRSSRKDSLWSLGLASLQTDCWSNFAWETNCNETDDDDRVMRQYLKSRPGIGVRFREITEQCLGGCFRCGSADLNNPHVESELLDVLSEMDGMISSLQQLDPATQGLMSPGREIADQGANSLMLIGQGASLCRSEKVVMKQGHGSRELHTYMKQRSVIGRYGRIPR